MGFTLSVISVAWISNTIFGMPLMISILLGAIIGGTSSPIVFPLVSELSNVKKEACLILKMESVITDPMAIIVSLVLIETITISPMDGLMVQELVTSLMSMLSISFMVGFFSGIIWGNIWHKFTRYRYHYMLTIGFLFFIYVITEFVGGSGAISAFMVGLVLGNMPSIKKMFKIKHTLAGLTKETRDFNSYIAFFVRTFFFALIGMMLTFSNTELILYGILISIILLGVRGFFVRICTYKLNISDREKNIMTFMYPRGLAAAVLASLPFIEYGIPGTQVFTEIVFTVIITTVLISTFGVSIIEKKNKIKKKINEVKKQAPETKDV